jgi:multiple sugar transport system substrate-binding protein
MRPLSRPTSAPPPSPSRSRGRRLRGLAAAAIAVTLLAASACGGSSGGQSANGEVTLRFNWWGSDTRHKLTQQVFDAFQQDHPNILIKGEFGEWAGYWDKLATTVAANDAPDIIQMDEKYLREYAKAAGVPLPDDKTWTWDQYSQLAQQISAKLNGKGWGTAAYGTNDASLNMWARQHGQSLFTKDGKLGVTKEGVTEFYTNLLKMQDAKAIPSAAFTAQDMNAPLDQSGMATGKLAMSYAWSNQLNALSKASGQQLKLLRLPSVTGKATENGAYYKGSMFWSISSRSKHPKEAAEFVNYLANSPAAGNILLAERGVPPNTEIRAEVASKLKPADAASQAFIQAISSELGEPSPPPPVGGGQVEKIIQRYTTEVLFGRMKPDQAAQKFIDEVNGELTK